MSKATVDDLRKAKADVDRIGDELAQARAEAKKRQRALQAAYNEVNATNTRYGIAVKRYDRVLRKLGEDLAKDK